MTGKVWNLAKLADTVKGVRVQSDSREALEAMGFKILGENNFVYSVVPPDGWKIRDGDDFTTIITDATGDHSMYQYSWGTPYLVIR